MRKAATAEKRAFLSQSDFPVATLTEALKIPRALADNFAGKDTPPHEVAMALDLSPTGSQWRMLAGCALAYGNFDPVVSVDNETMSKPLSDKVLDDMRACSFTVIHVEEENVLLDAAGEKHVSLNQNVLIEIGAALALHKNRFVLLVKEGVHAHPQ